MSWIGTENGGFALFYNLLQSMPTLFDFESKAKAVSGKRKRAC
jgi:hypothetical protein